MAAHQGGEFSAILLHDRRKFEPQTSARHYVLDDGVSANLPFAHQEIYLGRRADGTQRRGFDKKSTKT